MDLGREEEEEAALTHRVSVSHPEVERAADDGLIDDEAYDSIIEASEGARPVA
jgi:hypothetical protein